MANNKKIDPGFETAYLAAGCFWCTEAIYQRLHGVISVTPGYAGDLAENIETAKIVYDPEQISFQELLKVFWNIHDPTSWDRQGNDTGPAYRSVVFYASPEQQQAAEDSKITLEKSGSLKGKVVTQIRPASRFDIAEHYHQDYYQKHGDQPYCRLVIAPKLAHFEERFPDKLK
jgi:peptide-methionine (S)-S-oxide reductase